jgi:hypothetical protein
MVAFASRAAHGAIAWHRAYTATGTPVDDSISAIARIWPQPRRFFRVRTSHPRIIGDPGREAVSRARHQPGDREPAPGEQEGDTVHIIVTCECCGRRHSLARPLDRPQILHLICHDCERCLRVEVSARDMRRDAPVSAAR